MASKLIIYLNDEKIGEYPLARECTRIGRHDYNDLHLPHHTVSGEHALAMTVCNDSFLEDLDSTNGTWVNGKAITKHLLQDGDEVQIAAYVLKYSFDPAAVTREEGEDACSQMPHDRNNAGPGVTMRLPDADISREQASYRWQDNASLPLAALHMVSGPAAGRELLLDRVLTTLGKPGIQVAAITRHPEAYQIAYVEGEDCPLVNSRPVEEDNPVSLSHLDTVELAGIKMKFVLKPPL
ncbi:MAG: FHA domain-containing protein [Burkholderiales bacterium]